MTVRELDRRAAHRLAVIRHAQEVTDNVSKTCRYYGITRQAHCKCLRRHEAGGVAALRDGSSRPHSSPNATRSEVVGKVACRARPTASARTTIPRRRARPLAGGLVEQRVQVVGVDALSAEQLRPAPRRR